MTTLEHARTRPSYDPAAAFWAGLVTSLAALAASVFWFPPALGGNAWVYLRMAAAVLIGSDSLAPPASFEPGVAVAAGAVLLFLGFGTTLLVSLVLHRWGLLTGVLGGAVLGAILYAIIVLSLSAVFPWMIALRGPVGLAAHAVLGAVAGGAYELLDEDEEEVG